MGGVRSMKGRARVPQCFPGTAAKRLDTWVVMTRENENSIW